MNPSEIRTKNYICTSSGTIFYPFDPQRDHVHINDIAHSLSMKCRWNGHCHYFYSVAQHCLEVAEFVKLWGGTPEQQLQGLMHDAAEAYCVDMPTPLKAGFPDFIKVENRISEVIGERYHYDPIMDPLVHKADKVALYIEARNLFDNIQPWASVEEIPEDMVDYVLGAVFPKPMSSYHAKYEFIRKFHKLSDDCTERRLSRYREGMRMKK